jgi:hypothetical protein
MSIRHVVSIALVLSVVGCARSGPLNVSAFNPRVGVRSSDVLKKGFTDIYSAVFEKLDINKDGEIDEYEAGPTIDLRKFARVDQKRNGKLAKKEFLDFALGRNFITKLLPEPKLIKFQEGMFLHQARAAISGDMRRLDHNRDGYLMPEELSDKALGKLKINLSEPALNLKVYLKTNDPSLFEFSDKTKDGKLSQGEFEDYCMTAFLKLINENYAPGGAAQPEPQPAPVEPHH